MSCCLSRNPLIQLKTSPKFRAKKTSISFSARLENPQLNLSVLRFTLGIPGLDESYLPRWIGYGFGSLLLLNNFAASVSPTLPQLVRRVLLQWIKRVSQRGVSKKILISETTSNTRKDDLAWATYILLRNSNTVSVMVSVQNELCVRGYWSIPDDVSKSNVLDWFGKQIKSIGLSNLKETLYLPQIEDFTLNACSDGEDDIRDAIRPTIMLIARVIQSRPNSGLWEMLPEGTRSLLVQPVLHVLHPNDSGNANLQGFVLLASSMRYAYSDKDRAWARALAKKFRSM